MKPFRLRNRPSNDLRPRADERRTPRSRLVPIDDVRPLGDPEIARVATIQRGAVNVRQLHAAGLSKDVISDRKLSKRLHEVFHTVYLVGHAELAPLALETCGLLAVGDDAVLSHRSASGAWGFLPALKEVHVTVPERRARSRDGLAVHTTPRLDSRDRRIHQGLPMTAPARTLVDLARSLEAYELERALAEAIALRLVRSSEVTAAMARATDRRGLKRLGEVLEGGPKLTKSEMERRLVALLRSSSLPLFDHTNFDLGPWNADVVWLAARIVVELDTYTFHSSPKAFQRDRRKTIALEAQGWKVIRFTAYDLEREPHFVIATLAAAFADRRRMAA